MEETAVLLPTALAVEPRRQGLPSPANDRGRKTVAEAAADFFGARIANANTREAYLRDARESAGWAAERGLALHPQAPRSRGRGDLHPQPPPHFRPHDHRAKTRRGLSSPGPLACPVAYAETVNQGAGRIIPPP